MKPFADTSYNVHEIVLDLVEGHKSLEIGAGFGLLSKELKKRGFDTCACEIDPERINWLKHSGINCKKIDLDKGRLPYKSNFFDIILFVEVIEHLKHPYKIIEECSRVLKRRGVLILTTPNILNWYGRWKFLLSGEYNNYFEEKQFTNTYDRHIFPMHFYQLKWILENSGMKIEKIESNQYSGMINTQNLKTLFFSILTLPIRPFMKPKIRAVLEGDILIIKARKTK